MDYASLLTYFIMGFFGALIHYLLLTDGELELPRKKIKDGKPYLDLGCLAPLFIGALVGLLADANPVNAFVSGFAGESAIKGLLDKANGTIKIKLDGKKKVKKWNGKK